MLYLKHISLHRLIWVRRLMLWIALIGLFASIYLFMTYVTGVPIVCGLVSGCELVRASKWAYTFGIPRPALGIFFYSFIILGLTFRAYAPHHRPKFWTNVTWLAAFIGFIESGFLTMIQWLDIRAFCLWCLTSAVCATVLFVLSFFDTQDAMERSRALRELKLIFVSFLVAGIIGAGALYLLLAQQIDGQRKTEFIASPEADVSSLLLLPDTPIEGPATSSVTIVEFLDFQCPGCGALHPVMKAIREDFKGKIRYAQRMFPLSEIHPYAKGAAIAAVCSAKQNKYFEYADALMVNQKRLTRDDLIRYADALHLNRQSFVTCLDDPAVAAAVVSSRETSEKGLGIQSTPTIFVNHDQIEGLPNYDQLKAEIEKYLPRI